MKQALWLLLAMLLVSIGCDKQADSPDFAIAKLRPTIGHMTRGIVTFQEEESGVLVKATLKGLRPKSQHGWHIHQYGDIRDPKGKSAGGHYNPDGNPHGLPPTEKRHARLADLPATASASPRHRPL